jgi:cathepsin A (carboxypeptidase C)
MNLSSTIAVIALAVVVVSATGRIRETTGGWPACDTNPNVTQWSGYFDINGSSTKTSKSYFYWAFSPRSGNASAPVLLWMTGGPGCSSSLAILAENGPCHVNETTAELYHNPYSWNTDAYVIYIDQPAGVGFSYGGSDSYDSTEAQVSHDMYYFLQGFFKAHTNLLNNDFFVVGESYGGHFAPATAYRIMQGNQANEGAKIKLAGLAIGNGLTDPYIQYTSYPDLAYNWCQEQLGSPCVSYATYQSMLATVPGCQAAIAGCMQNNSIDCDLARMSCNGLIDAYEETGLNVYDIRKPCNGALCYNFNGAITFMNRADVQAALGAQPTTWTPCSDMVNGMFSQDWFKDFNYTVPALMENGVRVLVYNGDDDFIVNWIGSKNWTTALQWAKQSEFQQAPDRPIIINTLVSALVRSVASATSPIQFSFMQVHGAGHMVPMDQPRTALYMISKFMSNMNFI